MRDAEAAAERGDLLSAEVVGEAKARLVHQAAIVNACAREALGARAYSVTNHAGAGNDIPDEVGGEKDGRICGVVALDGSYWSA